VSCAGAGETGLLMGILATVSPANPAKGVQGARLQFILGKKSLAYLS
jgi:hypothetical protein